jgi:phage terminase small subunit
MTQPKPPKHLSREAKALWERIYGSVELDEAAILLLDTMCTAWQRMEEARQAIANEGGCDRLQIPRHEGSESLVPD